MNPLQPNGFCRKSSLAVFTGLFIGLSPTSHADFADSATASVEAVFKQGIGLYGTVDLGKCTMRPDPGNPSGTAENKLPANTLSNLKLGDIRDVATSLNNSHVIRMTFDNKEHPTYVVRSENLRITPGDESGGNPGWIIREFRFTMGAAMEADIQLSSYESWTWDCNDSAISITNELPLTPPPGKPLSVDL